MGVSRCERFATPVRSCSSSMSSGRAVSHSESWMRVKRRPTVEAQTVSASNETGQRERRTYEEKPVRRRLP
jgi:hypothetical protein